MSIAAKARPTTALGAAVGAALAALAALALAAPASAAGPPGVAATWATGVGAVVADLQAEVNPNEAPTSFHFDYLTEAAYEANLQAGRPAFSGASRAPLAGEPSAGSGSATVTVTQRVALFRAATSYRYRAVARNPHGEAFGPTRRLTTRSTATPSTALPDNRGWELLTPPEKGSAQVGLPGELLGGGVFQASLSGDAFTYSTNGAFGEGAGAPPASQYLALRGAAGWSSQSLDPPIFSGSYPWSDGAGVPFRVFSPDLASALLANGQRCRGALGECPVPNPPLDPSAPAGYRNYYLRSQPSGAYSPLLTVTPPLPPGRFELAFAGATPDLSQAVLSTCAALTPDATEVPAGEGCDEAEQNLYLRNASGLTAVNLLPAEAQSSPGAQLAAPAGAISGDGARVYFSHDGDLYLREGAATKQVDGGVGGGGEFQAAGSDGALAFFTRGGHLYRYQASSGEAVDLTPGGGVEGVLGASGDGSRVFYLSASGLFMRQGGTTTPIAASADASNYPPATGAARLSADGTRLVFAASQAIADYDSGGLSQLYLYDAVADRLRCLSCNPTGGRPSGPSWIPAAQANGSGPGATQAYKPRALSADGRRLFFTSGDALVPNDSDSRADVYEWEEEGTGSCQAPGGCLFLISGGRLAGGEFVDADRDGSDVFFASEDSLVGRDPDALDIYVARVGGGFPEPTPPIPCNGDECQGPAFAPEAPTPVTATLQGPGNPPLRFARAGKRRCGKGKVRRKGRCVKRGSRKSAKGKRKAAKGKGAKGKAGKGRRGRGRR